MAARGINAPPFFPRGFGARGGGGERARMVVSEKPYRKFSRKSLLLQRGFTVICKQNGEYEKPKKVFVVGPATVRGPVKGKGRSFRSGPFLQSLPL